MQEQTLPGHSDQQPSCINATAPAEGKPEGKLQQGLWDVQHNGYNSRDHAADCRQHHPLHTLECLTAGGAMHNHQATF